MSSNSYLSGIFVNKALSSSGNWVSIGTVTGSGDFGTIGINVTNTSTTDNVTFSLAISNETTPNLQDYIESNLTLSPGGTLSRSKIIAGIGENVLVLASSNSLACRLYGVTQGTYQSETNVGGSTTTTVISDVSTSGSSGTSTTSTLAGATSGSVEYVVNQFGSSQMIIMTFINYVNETSTSQIINFPVDFNYTPMVNSDILDLDLQVSKSGLTINSPGNSTAFNGNVLITGI